MSERSPNRKAWEPEESALGISNREGLLTEPVSGVSSASEPECVVVKSQRRGRPKTQRRQEADLEPSTEIVSCPRGGEGEDRRLVSGARG